MSAVVGDAQFQARRDGAELDADDGGVRGVLADVGEGFADDAVDGGGDFGGDRLVEALLDVQGDGRAGARVSLGEGVHIGQSGERPTACGVLPQDVDQAAHRAQGLAAGGLDPFEGGVRPWPVECGEAGGAGLDDDAGDVVGDHVVQFAGEFQAFGGPYGGQVAHPLGVLPAQDHRIGADDDGQYAVDDGPQAQPDVTHRGEHAGQAQQGAEDRGGAAGGAVHHAGEQDQQGDAFAEAPHREGVLSGDQDHRGGEGDARGGPGADAQRHAGVGYGAQADDDSGGDDRGVRAGGLPGQRDALETDEEEQDHGEGGFAGGGLARVGARPPGQRAHGAAGPPPVLPLASPLSQAQAAISTRLRASSLTWTLAR